MKPYKLFSNVKKLIIPLLLLNNLVSVVASDPGINMQISTYNAPEHQLTLHTERSYQQPDISPDDVYNNYLSIAERSNGMINDIIKNVDEGIKNNFDAPSVRKEFKDFAYEFNSLMDTIYTEVKKFHSKSGDVDGQITDKQHQISFLSSQEKIGIMYALYEDLFSHIFVDIRYQSKNIWFEEMDKEMQMKIDAMKAIDPKRYEYKQEKFIDAMNSYDINKADGIILSSPYILLSDENVKDILDHMIYVLNSFPELSEESHMDVIKNYFIETINKFGEKLDSKLHEYESFIDSFAIAGEKKKHPIFKTKGYMPGDTFIKFSSIFRKIDFAIDFGKSNIATGNIYNEIYEIKKYTENLLQKSVDVQLEPDIREHIQSEIEHTARLLLMTTENISGSGIRYNLQNSYTRNIMGNKDLENDVIDENTIILKKHDEITSNLHEISTYFESITDLLSIYNSENNQQYQDLKEKVSDTTIKLEKELDENFSSYYDLVVSLQQDRNILRHKFSDQNSVSTRELDYIQEQERKNNIYANIYARFLEHLNSDNDVFIRYQDDGVELNTKLLDSEYIKELFDVFNQLSSEKLKNFPSLEVFRKAKLISFVFIPVDTNTVEIKANCESINTEPIDFCMSVFFPENPSHFDKNLFQIHIEKINSIIKQFGNEYNSTYLLDITFKYMETIMKFASENLNPNDIVISLNNFLEKFSENYVPHADIKNNDISVLRLLISMISLFSILSLKPVIAHSFRKRENEDIISSNIGEQDISHVSEEIKQLVQDNDTLTMPEKEVIMNILDVSNTIDNIQENSDIVNTDSIYDEQLQEIAMTSTSSEKPSDELGEEVLLSEKIKYELQDVLSQQVKDITCSLKSEGLGIQEDRISDNSEENIKEVFATFAETDVSDIDVKNYGEIMKSIRALSKQVDVNRFASPQIINEKISQMEHAFNHVRENSPIISVRKSKKSPKKKSVKKSKKSPKKKSVKKSKKSPRSPKKRSVKKSKKSPKKRSVKKSKRSPKKKSVKKSKKSLKRKSVKKSKKSPRSPKRKSVKKSKKSPKRRSVKKSKKKSEKRSKK